MQSNKMTFPLIRIRTLKIHILNQEVLGSIPEGSFQQTSHYWPFSHNNADATDPNSFLQGGG